MCKKISEYEYHLGTKGLVRDQGYFNFQGIQNQYWASYQSLTSTVRYSTVLYRTGSHAKIMKKYLSFSMVILFNPNRTKYTDTVPYHTVPY